MVTHQLQVEPRTGEVRRPETDVLPLCYTTKQALGEVFFNIGVEISISSTNESTLSYGNEIQEFEAEFLQQMQLSHLLRHCQDQNAC